MASDPTQRILHEYRAELQLYNGFGLKLETLISELLASAQIRVHSVSHRIKDESSLAEKLARPGNKYTGLPDVTDICGVRVITYFAGEVDAVAHLIEREFSIDRVNSIDKRAAIDPDRFGYLSVHYVVSLELTRVSLPEYAPFRDCTAEVQIRSILQHAWAEIEHDLGYKSRSAVPRDIIRQFSRLASILELADEGFNSLRKNLSTYQSEVSAKIALNAGQILLDAISIKALIDSDPCIKELDELLSSRIHLPLVEEYGNKAIASHAAAASRLGFETIGELQSALQNDKAVLGRFMDENWKQKDNEHRDAIPRGIALYYFLLLRAMRQKGQDLVLELYSFRKDDPTTQLFLTHLQTAFEAAT
jgi:ppGpp synthetase/RelA/SpoT-type nucleotidyltranferase